MGRGYDETGEKGVCIVTLEEEARLQAVSLQTPRFYDLEAEVRGDAAAAVDAVLPAVPGNDFYRITLTGSGDVDLDVLQKQFAAFPNLQLRDQTEPPLEIWEDTDKDTLEGIYFGMLRDAMEQDPDNAERIRLAAEISRKLLSGREVKL